MTPERWEQVKELFNSAVVLEHDKRGAFLAHACSGDDAVRKEVESLLAAHERDGSFIDAPAFQVKARELIEDQTELQPGQMIGPYEILSFLGKGGMGQVYLARDRRLGRNVALKFLPALVTTDAQRLKRFEQEARAASALNHPNILTIHEVGKTTGQPFIATEFIEGETLRQRIAKQSAPATSRGVKELIAVLRIVEQVSSALSAAHQAGIIHRDVKPENIMIRQDGIVKVLDFGLAKLTETKASAPDDSTRVLAQTGEGIVMGTVAYMSPEQARGQPLDARTDIWSLGVVFYELLTSQPPFKGSTTSDVIVSVLEREPVSISHQLADAPPELDWIVSKTLTKERDDRYQTARELQNDLRRLTRRLDLASELERTTPSGPTLEVKRAKMAISDTGETLTRDTEARAPAQPLKTSSVAATLRQRPMLVTLFVLAIAVGIVLYLLFLQKRAADQTQSNSETVATNVPQIQITTWSGLDMYPSLSPDGNSVAYSSDHNGPFEIYVKQLAPGGREIQLTNDGGQNFEPAWSPDGKLIAYHSKTRGGIWLMPALGGTSRQITEFGSYPTWSPDGSLIAFQSSSIGDDLSSIASGALLPATIWVVPSTGGEAKQITQVGNPAGGHGSPTWSPDGKRIVFGAYDPETSDIWSVEAQGGQPKKVVKGVDPVYSPDGKRLYFVTFGKALNFGISRVDLSEAGGAIGEPVQMASTGTARVKRLTISADGTKLSYGALTIRSNLWSVPLSQTAQEATGSPVALTHDTSYRNSHPTFSPDGQKLAYHASRVGASQDIWLLDADGRNPTQLTTAGRSERPSWFPSGDRVAFLGRRDDVRKLLSIELKSGKEKQLFDIQQDMTFPQISPDGKLIVFNSKKSGTTNIWTVTIDGGTPRQLTFDKETMGFACWSPDSQWIGFEIKRGDDSNVGYISRHGGEPIQLTSERGQSWPHSFSPDGDKIAFAGFRNGFWNVWWVSRSNRAQKQITNHSKLNAFVRYPTWSPLGNQIVYEYAESTGNIWMMALK